MSRPAAAVHRVIKAYDVRGLVGAEIDESFVAEVGAAFAQLMRDEGAQRVAIGYDMRDSSPSLAAAFATGVTAQGLDVVRIGLASTDQLYFASGLLDCPGAMFTASHNPAAYNGIKMCRAGAKPVGADTGLAVISDDVRISPRSRALWTAVMSVPACAPRRAKRMASVIRATDAAPAPKEPRACEA